VLLGRAALYGAAAGGEQGVQRALNILHGEVDRTLALIGCRSIEELSPRFLLGDARPDTGHHSAQTGRRMRAECGEDRPLPAGVVPIRRRKTETGLTDTRGS